MNRRPQEPSPPASGLRRADRRRAEAALWRVSPERVRARSAAKAEAATAAQAGEGEQSAVQGAQSASEKLVETLYEPLVGSRRCRDTVPPHVGAQIAWHADGDQRGR